MRIFTIVWLLGFSTSVFADAVGIGFTSESELNSAKTCPADCPAASESSDASWWEGLIDTIEDAVTGEE